MAILACLLMLGIVYASDEAWQWKAFATVIIVVGCIVF